MTTRPITHIVLHQSGKVGSSALQAALAADPRLTVVKSHFLSPTCVEFFERLSSHRECPPRLAATLSQQTAEARRIRELLETVPPEDCCILGGVRDPLTFAVSAFFQNLSFLVPNARLSTGDADAEAARLVDQFHELFARCHADAPDDPLSQYAHWVLAGASVEWFEWDYLPMYHLAGDSLPAMQSSLLRFRHGGRLHVIYRFEAFPACLDEVFEQTGIGPLVLDAENVSAAKPYAQVYAAFQSQFRPTTAMWDFYYDSDFFRRFYPHQSPAHDRPLAVFAPADHAVKNLHHPPSGRIARSERGGVSGIPAVSGDDYQTRPPRALEPDPPEGRVIPVGVSRKPLFLRAENASQRCPAASDSPGDEPSAGEVPDAQQSVNKVVDAGTGSTLAIPAAQRREVYVPHAGWLSFPPQDQVAQNLVEGWFEALEQAFVWLFARPGDVFVDCGAQVGLFTLVAAAAGGPSTRVIALEPLPDHAALLRQNVAANQLQGVELIEAAAGNHCGRTRLYAGAAGMGAWSTVFPPAVDTPALPAAGRSPAHDVPLVTLDSVVASRRVSHVAFLKIDVEGAEAEVLAGFEKTLAARRVDVLMVEFTDENLRRAGIDTRTLFDAIAARGLTCCRFDPESRQLRPARYEAPIEYENLFAAFDVAAVNRRLDTAPPDRVRIAQSLIEQALVRRHVMKLGSELRDARAARQHAERRLKEAGQLRQRAETQLRVSEQRLQRAQIRLKQTKHALEVAEGRLPLEQLVRQTERRLDAAEARCEAAERKLDPTARSLSAAERQHVEDCQRASRAEAAIARFHEIGQQLQASQNYRWMEAFFPALQDWCDAVKETFEDFCTPRSPATEPVAPTGDTPPSSDDSEVLPMSLPAETNMPAQDQRKAA